MRTVNSDFLKSYDKFKEDIFHSKKEEHKENLRKKAKPLQPISLKKIFPWKTLTKLSALAGAIYLAYNYTQSFVDQIINKNFFSKFDLIGVKVIKQDLKVKFKTAIQSPQQIKNLSHFANCMYKNQLQTSLNYLKKIYPTHKLKCSLQSGLKVWIFQFNNYEKSQYVNQFGDVIERDQNSFLRIWRYPIFKDRKEKVLQEQKNYKQYRTLLQSFKQKESQNERIQRQIVSKCESINILNRLSPQYQELLTECRKNQSYGKAFTKLIQNRKKLYPYASLNSQIKSQEKQQTSN